MFCGINGTCPPAYADGVRKSWVDKVVKDQVVFGFRWGSNSSNRWIPSVGFQPSDSHHSMEVSPPKKSNDFTVGDPLMYSTWTVHLGNIGIR